MRGEVDARRSGRAAKALDGHVIKGVRRVRTSAKRVQRDGFRGAVVVEMTSDGIKRIRTTTRT